MSHNISIVIISLVIFFIFILLLLLRRKYVLSYTTSESNDRLKKNTIRRNQKIDAISSHFENKNEEKQEIKLARIRHEQQLKSKKRQIIMAILASVIFLLITVHQMFFGH